MSVSSESMEIQERSEIKPDQTLRGHTSSVYGVAHLPDRQHIITCSGDASLRLWNLESGAQIGSNWKEDGDKAGVFTIALSPNSKTVASGSIGGAVKLWDVETGKVTAKWTGNTSHVWSVRWSADGMCVASGSEDETVRVWEIESGETVLGPIKTGNGSVFTMAYSPDSSSTATGGGKGIIEIWDTTTGERLSTLEQDYPVWSLAWTSDQKKLIAGFQNGSIRIFNTATWNQIAILEGHTSFVNALSLFQNDRLLASASDDYTARLWNLDTNLPVGPPLQHQDIVWDAALSADGKFLVTACGDKNAYVWDTLTIFKDSGFEGLLSFPSDDTGINSILDCDATPYRAGSEDTVGLPEDFLDTPDGILSPTTPTNPPPATLPTDYPPSTVHSDPPVSTTQADSLHPPTHYRHNILSFFSVSGARALLRHVLPRFYRSRSNHNPSTHIPGQNSSQPLVSVHEPAIIQVPVAMDNELDASEQGERALQRIAIGGQDRAQPHTTRTHPHASKYHRLRAIAPLGRISERFRSSHPNNNQFTELHEISARSHHGSDVVEVAEFRDNQLIAVAPPSPEEMGQIKRLKYDTWWARCIFYICCEPIPESDVNEGTNDQLPVQNPTEPTYAG